MVLPFNKETMMMVALVAVIVGALYLYKDLQLTKKDLVSLKNKPVPVPQVQRKKIEIDDEIKNSNTVADEQ
jgi:hypothetical protein